jgi:hypothetical protein
MHNRVQLSSFGCTRQRILDQVHRVQRPVTYAGSDFDQ